MISALPFVEIPGYREAVRRERDVRDAAWLDGRILLCGAEVVPLSLRRMVWMDQARCGIICPWRFDSQEELVTHCVLFLWMLRASYRPPTSPRASLWRAFRDGMSQHRFARRVLRSYSPEKLTEEIKSYLDLAFMDAPVGSGNGANQSYASHPAYVFDHFAAAGFTMSQDEILDMPLPRLWQLWRVAAARTMGAKLTNPSDTLATNYLASLHQPAAS